MGDRQKPRTERLRPVEAVGVLPQLHGGPVDRLVDVGVLQLVPEPVTEIPGNLRGVSLHQLGQRALVPVLRYAADERRVVVSRRFTHRLEPPAFRPSYTTAS